MILLKNITKYYEKKNTAALNNINLELKQGSLIGFIGRNGAGKSTLFKIINGIIKDYEGELHIGLEKDSTGMYRDMSYLPEVRGLDSRQYILEHIVDIICYKGFRRKDMTIKVQHWLEEFGLQDVIQKKIHTLSKGNQQKLQFICAAASEPKLLILDEPFSGLDAIAVHELWSKMLEMRKRGMTIIFSTHNLNNSLLCDEYVFITKGSIVENGRIEDIQNRYPLLLELISSEINEDLLKQVSGVNLVDKENKKYTIKVSSMSAAKELYHKLNKPFCELFQVRKKTISELFLELNKDDQNE